MQYYMVALTLLSDGFFVYNGYGKIGAIDFTIAYQIFITG